MAEYNPTLEEYRRERRRIQSFIRRAKKRGYKFPEDIVPKIPKNIDEGSVRRLKRLTKEKLYRASTYNTDTGTIKGTEQRKREQQESARKAAETKKAREAFYKFKEEVKADEIETVSATSVILDNVLDDINILDRYAGTEVVDTDINADYTSKSGVGEIVSDVKEKIDNWQPESHWTSSLTKAKENDHDTLKKIFYEAKAELGDDELAKRLADRAKDIMEMIEEILYGSGSKEGNFKDGRTKVNADIVRFTEIIQGHMLNVDESIAITEYQNSYEYEDYGFDE